MVSFGNNEIIDNVTETIRFNDATENLNHFVSTLFNETFNNFEVYLSKISWKNKGKCSR